MFGKQTVTFCEKDQPQCVRTYGEAPCVAKLGVTGTIKCHNTPHTCQDPANYSAQTITVRFSRSQDGLREYGYAIPSIAGDVRTTPARINLAGLDENMAALGAREQVTVALHDHRHSDLLVDKYRLERAFEGAIRWPGRHRPRSFRKQGPERVARAAFFGEYDVDADPYRRGTYWGKFLARHPFYPSFAWRVLEGEVGQALLDMRTRHYVIERIEGPQDGQVTVNARDIFTKIESRKAVAPFPSLGELSANLTGTPATFSVNPSGIGNLTPEEGGYSPITGGTQGYVNIGDEIIKVTRSGDTFTVVERGALNTLQEDHDDDDLVQLVLEYSVERVEDILYDLVTNYSFIPAAAIDFPEWQAAAAEITDLFTTRIARPTPVEDLVGELMQQSGVTLVPDVTTGMIRFVPLRAGVISPTVTEAAYIRDGSLRHRREEGMRVSSVWVYYGMKNPSEDVDDERNYHSRLVSADVGAADNYGSDETRKVFSRWIPQFGRDLAERVGARILAMYRDPPVRATFNVTAERGSEFALGRYFYLEVAELQSVLGPPAPVPMAAISIARGEHEWTIEGQTVAFSGDPVDGDNTRRIHIENSATDINLRSVHDTLFAAPTGTETIEFTVDPGVVVSATNALVAALRTGSWPAGVTLTLINQGTVLGKGGNAGNGGALGPGNGGQNGGTAFQAEYAITVNNTSGSLKGGGGGGGGGGAGRGETGGEDQFAGGGGGGGGAGTNVGAGGSGAPGDTSDGQNGTNGTATTGGDGGIGGTGINCTGGEAGDGGALGQPGTAGAPGTGNVGQWQGGSGGEAGKYAEGNAFITWVGDGERIGGVS